jgi:hypothetical protein
MNISPSQALHNLYIAARLAPLKAEEHDILADSAKILDEFINPKAPSPAPQVKEVES